MTLEFIFIIVKLLCLTLSFYLTFYKIFPKFSIKTQRKSFFLGITTLTLLFYITNSFTSVLASFVVTICLLFVFENFNETIKVDQKKPKRINVEDIKSKPLSTILSNVKLTALFQKFKQYEIISDDITLEDFQSSFLQKTFKLKNLSLAELVILYNFFKIELNCELKQNQFCALLSINYESFRNSKNKISDRNINKMKLILNI